jgi:hypothetical protein
MKRLRWKYLTAKNNLWNLGSNFLIPFGSIWLLMECSSALSTKVKTLVEKCDPWILVITVTISLLYTLYKSFPRVVYTKKFKSCQTSISLKVGDLLNETQNIVIGSSNYFDFTYNQQAGVSLKSQIIDKLFNNDIDYINNLTQKSLKGLEHLAVIDKEKKYGNKSHYPTGTVVVLPQSDRKIFAVILTKLVFKENEKHTESDPQILNKALLGLWKKIEVEGRKKKFSMPVLGAGLSNVQLSHLLIIQSIILSYAIYSRRFSISEEMTIVISPKDYNPDDFEEAVQFLNSLQI